jgi:hypothetical protein
MPDYSNLPTDPQAMMAMMGPFLIVGLVIFAFFIFVWWRIFSKAGYPGALALVFLAGIIPLIGPLICLGLIVWFAFVEWPVQKKAKGAG